MEELTGKKFDEKKFEEACANANRTASAWLRVCDYLQYKNRLGSLGQQGMPSNMTRYFSGKGVVGDAGPGPGGSHGSQRGKEGGLSDEHGKD